MIIRPRLIDGNIEFTLESLMECFVYSRAEYILPFTGPRVTAENSLF